MAEVLYYRKKHIITDVDGKVVFTGTIGSGEAERPSINAAKRKSRELQAASGPGSLRVRD